MSGPPAATAGHRAVSLLYQALLTGCVLTLVTRRGETMAAELVFRLFDRPAPVFFDELRVRELGVRR